MAATPTNPVRKQRLKTNSMGEPLGVQSVGIASNPQKTPLVSTTEENYARRIVPNVPTTTMTPEGKMGVGTKPQFTGQAGQYAYTPTGELLSQEEYKRISPPRPVGTPLDETMVRPTEPVPRVQEGVIGTASQEQVNQIFQPQLGQPTPPVTPESAIAAVQAGTATPEEQRLYGQVSGEAQQVTAEDVTDVALLATPGGVLKGLGKGVAKTAEEIAGKQLIERGAGKLQRKAYEKAFDEAGLTAKTTINKLQQQGDYILKGGVGEAELKASTGVLTSEQAKLAAMNQKLINEAGEKLRGSWFKKMLKFAIDPRVVGGSLLFSYYMTGNKAGDALQPLSTANGKLDTAYNNAKKVGDIEMMAKIKAKKDEVEGVMFDITNPSMMTILSMAAPLINYPLSEIRNANAVRVATEATHISDEQLARDTEDINNKINNPDEQALRIESLGLDIEKKKAELGKKTPREGTGYYD